ncbi:hypothetical protein [Paraburkholderia sp. J10-1]|uniref:hypothetical protein n=1 Tax=Paraburkholderia sp. J10-1 TaxID=2805430 RepID=UPI002AB665D6|nr:hypothetical protein [Paraburkholderia sp. J10-1]
MYKRQRSASSERALLRDGAVQVDGVEVQRDIAFQNACTERVGLRVPEQGTLNVVALATNCNGAKGWDVERATLLSATSRHRRGSLKATASGMADRSKRLR